MRYSCAHPTAKQYSTRQYYDPLCHYDISQKDDFDSKFEEFLERDSHNACHRARIYNDLSFDINDIDFLPQSDEKRPFPNNHLQKEHYRKSTQFTNNKKNQNFGLKMNILRKQQIENTQHLRSSFLSLDNGEDLHGDDFIETLNSIDLNTQLGRYLTRNRSCLVSNKYYKKQTCQKMYSSRPQRRHEYEEQIKEKANKCLSATGIISKQSAKYFQGDIYEHIYNNLDISESFVQASNLTFFQFISPLSFNHESINSARQMSDNYSHYLMDDFLFEEEYMQLPKGNDSPNQKKLKRKKKPQKANSKVKAKARRYPKENILSLDNNANYEQTLNCPQQYQNNGRKLKREHANNEKFKDLYKEHLLDLPYLLDNCLNYPTSPVPDWDELCQRVFRFKQLPELSTTSKVVSIDDHRSLLDLEAPKDAESTLYSNVESILGSSNILQEMSGNSTLPDSNTSGDESKTDKTPNNDNLLMIESQLIDNEVNTNSDFDRLLFDEIDFIANIAKAMYPLGVNAQVNEKDDCDCLQMTLNKLDVNSIQSNSANLPSALAYKTLLLDLCKETVLRTFTLVSNTNATLTFPLKGQKQRWPSTEQQLSQILIEQVKLLENDPTKTWCATESKRSSHQSCRPPMNYYRRQRKLDYVYSLLYSEMLHDEQNWSCRSPMVQQIKQQLIQNMNLSNTDALPE